MSGPQTRLRGVCRGTLEPAGHHSGAGWLCFKISGVHSLKGGVTVFPLPVTSHPSGLPGLGLSVTAFASVRPAGRPSTAQHSLPPSSNSRFFHWLGHSGPHPGRVLEAPCPRAPGHRLTAIQALPLVPPSSRRQGIGHSPQGCGACI